MAGSRNLLSDSISKYRRAAGMTQEELGQRVGVSTQAVSKWECGGMPDPSLLPAVSDALGVTIDALFGRGNPEDNDVEKLAERALIQTPPEQRFQKIYQLCWTMMCANVAHELPELGTVGDMLSALQRVQRKPAEADPSAHIITYKSDRGIEEASLAEDYQYHLVIPKPQNGYSSICRDEDSYLKLFALLARPNRLKVLAFLDQVKYANFTADYAAAQLSISQQEAEEALEDLRAHRFVYTSSLATAEQVRKAYFLNSSLNLIPFLLFTGQVMQERKIPRLLINTYEKPLMDGPLGNGNPQAHWDTDGNMAFNLEINSD